MHIKVYGYEGANSVEITVSDNDWNGWRVVLAWNRETGKIHIETPLRYKPNSDGLTPNQMKLALSEGEVIRSAIGKTTSPREVVRRFIEFHETNKVSVDGPYQLKMSRTFTNFADDQDEVWEFIESICVKATSPKEAPEQTEATH